MPLGRSVWVRRILALGLLAIFFALPVLAQQSEEDKPWFDVPTLELQKPYIQWIFGMLFVAVSLLIAFKNPHRTHLD